MSDAASMVATAAVVAARLALRRLLLLRDGSAAAPTVQAERAAD